MKLKKTKSIYVISNPLIGIVKIGYSDNVCKRVQLLQGQAGMVLKTKYCSPPIHNYAEIESALHQKFAQYRKLGEWFEIDFETVAAEIVVLQRKYKLDPVLEAWQKENNVSLLARELGVSRAAIIKRLNKNKMAAFILDNNIEETVDDEIIKEEISMKRVMEDGKFNIEVPQRALRVARNILAYNDVYYVKVYRDGRFLTEAADSLEEAMEIRDTI